MSDGLFSSVQLESDHRAGYRLRRIEVYNWGTFDRHVWTLEPAGETALLTGDIGSGKSTLVDAVTTLLLPAHKISYNKAAGADSRERSLRSYVEGYFKSERAESAGRSKHVGLRSGQRTYSVILGCFVNEGYDETVTLAQVFQQRDATGQPDRFYVTATEELSIAKDFADFGPDLRELRKRLRARDIDLFTTYPQYGTALRRLLGIRSEQALELFHQTVSMKSVGNLDDFVRDHMLEPVDADQRVHDVIGHFENLTRAYDAVKRAREQLTALAPIVQLAAQYDEALADRESLETHRAAVDWYITELRARLLTGEIALLEERADRLRQAQDAATTSRARLAGERETLIEDRARAGGDRIGELERLSAEARATAETRRTARDRFDAAVAEAGWTGVTDAAEFDRMRADIADERARTEDARHHWDNAFAEARSVEKELRARAEGVQAELRSLTERQSNIPVDQVAIRDQMCADLAVPATELPYAGELIDVGAEHDEWRGAAERVLRPFALSLLVPQQHYDAVAAWVNERRLMVARGDGRSVGARLVYERVSTRRVRTPRPQPADEGTILADLLEVRSGMFEDYLRTELEHRADHRCAVTLDEFRHARRAVTREGQVRSGDRHVKDDRHRVDDARRWVLGWVNENKIAALRTELAEIVAAGEDATTATAGIEERRTETLRKRDALNRIADFESWSALDVEEALRRADEHDAECARLRAGSSRLDEIARALDRNRQQSAEVEDEITRITGEVATSGQELARARAQWETDGRAVSQCPAADLATARQSYDALDATIGDRRPSTSADCAGARTGLLENLHERIERLGRDAARHGQGLSQRMSGFLAQWPELAADLDAAVESRRDFCAYHERIATDDLPRFEADFKNELNKNTIQELAGFNNWLGRQASAIDDRIARINDGLSAVDYNPGRHIRLEKQPTGNQDVVQFRSDLRDLTNDSLVVDGEQYSEQRFLDVKRIIERFRGREGYADADRAWTRRVTDVRNWFVFSASERDTATDEEWEHYSDSDGKSGGQKEKLAYTILAASLAYQFGLEWGATKSKDFRFAVIDEAFGRGSDVSTRYALDLFAKLGLQLLIVTPLQKVHVIEPYVRAIGFVDNITGTASRLQTMSIEEYRAERDRHRS